MTKDRRTNKKLTRDEVSKLLSHKQYAALLQCQEFGWRLKFIRTAQSTQPVPVLYNARIDQIGVLDPDGQVNIDRNLGIRAAADQPAQVSPAPRVEGEPGVPEWKEKRCDTLPVPDNLDDLLNKLQMRALNQIEGFGWQLQFVRRPLFQDPVPVILSPDGKRYATLESDGRINMTPDSTLRKEASQEAAAAAAPAPGAKRSGYA